MRHSRTIIATLALGLSTFAAHAAEVTVVSWGGAYQDAQRKVYFAPFQKTTGITLKEDSWDGGLGILRSRASASDPGWDLVQVETGDVLLGCEEGLLEPLDYSKIGGKDVYIPGAAEECGLAALLYNEGIAYDRDKLKTAPQGWADFFDLTKFPGKRALRLTPIVALPGALIADGVKPDEVYKVLATNEGVDRALAKLDTIKSQLIFWKAGAQPGQLLASGEVVMSTAYNGRIDAADRNDHRNFAFVWNGSFQTFDYWAILKGSPRKDSAYSLLNFINQPERQSKFPDEIAYGVPLQEAGKSISPARLVDNPSNPANASVSVPQNGRFWLENLDRLTERFQAWSSK